jgi:VanZ family protein
LIDTALWACSLVSATVLVWFSVAAIPPTPSGSAGDEILHGLAYAFTFGTFLLAAVWRPGRGPGILDGYETVLAVAALALGVALEALQAAVGRDPSALDAAADAIGVALAWAGHRILRRVAAP